MEKVLKIKLPNEAIANVIKIANSKNEITKSVADKISIGSGVIHIPENIYSELKLLTTLIQ